MIRYASKHGTYLNVIIVLNLIVQVVNWKNRLSYPHILCALRKNALWHALRNRVVLGLITTQRLPTLTSGKKTVNSLLEA